MALNNVTFNRTSGGVGRPLAGKDHISAMLYYTDTLPSGFSATDRIKKIYSISDAENLGITNTHADETKATGGKYVVGGTWLEGETIALYINGALLGSHTVLSGGTATGAIATALATSINALTKKHGYSATDSTNDVLLTAPTGLGVAINAGTNLESAQTTAGGTITTTQFTSGVGSIARVMHYDISEFFRMQPKGILYVGIYAAGTYDATQITTIQNYANGEIRQIGVRLQAVSFATSQITTTQSITTALRTAKKPLSVVLHPNMASVTLSSISDISLLTSSDVSVVIGEDANYNQALYSNTKNYIKGDKVRWSGGCYQCIQDSLGNAPYETAYFAKLTEDIKSISGFSISTLGNTLGSISLSKVNECIAWVNKFNLASGITLDDISFCEGTLWNTASDSLKDELNDKHFIFLRKFQGVSGTYYNDSFTAISITNDFATIENNRTLDKAERLVYTSIIGRLNSPLYVNSDGTLTADTVDLFRSDCERQLDVMQADGEISQYSVEIDPTQDVITTGKLVITIKNIPVGVARNIIINSGFTTQII